MAFASSAYAKTLSIVNGSASTLTGIYISDSGTDDWEENILAGQKLKPGEQFDIDMQVSYKKFDMRVEAGSASEDYFEYPGSTKKITIHGGGDSDYE